MAIDFIILKSPLAAHPTGHSARVKSKGTISFEKVTHMVANRRTTVAKSDVLSVLEDFFDTVEELLQDGYTVVTPHTILRTAIQGNFEHPADEFDPHRHLIVVRITAGKRLRRAMRDVQARKLKWEPPHPRPLNWIDVATGAQNGPVTPGGEGRIIGSGLRFDPADPRQGVFFIAADKTETRAEELTLNTPGHLIVRIPVLPAGWYKVEVRALVNNYQVRAGQLDQKLTVEG
jgi:hypothetical protein